MRKYLRLFLCIAPMVSTVSFSQVTDNFFEKLNLNGPSLKTVKELYEKGDESVAKKALLDAFRKKENLYLRTSKEDIPFVLKNFKEEVETSIKTADEVRNNYFLFRYEWDMEKTTIPYQFKKGIDWQINPFGDEEWTFMLSRHRYWLDLGKAYLLTGKEKYAKTFVDQATHWIDENPRIADYKWTTWRRIEAGIRAENWIKTFEYFKDSKYITPEFFEKFLNALYVHAEFIDESYSRHSQMSNWGVIEFHGLFNLAVFLSDFKEASKWKESAVNKLTTCIQNQILEDGTQWEQSPMYHNEVFHCYLNTVLLAKRNKIKLPEVLLKKTLDMAYANLEWQKPNYHEPLLGDSDDNDLRGMLTTATVLLNDGTLKSRAFKTFDYESFFLFGQEAIKSYESIKPVSPKFLSAYQENSGDLYSRSSWDENAFFSSFHMKRIGGGHSHDNLLHFTLFGNGRDYLIDGGRYTYVYNDWRKYFKDNKAHNTLGVDDLPNSIYDGSWSNSFEAKSEGAYVKITDGFDYAEAINIAYQRLEDPVIMKRRMLYLKPDVWLLVDSFTGKEEHTYSQYFNFADKEVEIKGNGLSTTQNGNNLRIQAVKEVSLKLEDAWWSPEYNYKEEIKRGELFVKNKGFTSLITLLYFPEKSNVEYEKIPVYNRNDKAVSDEEAEAVKISCNEQVYILVVAHNHSNNLNTFLIADGQVVSGEVVLIEHNKGGQKIHVIK